MELQEKVNDYVNFYLKQGYPEEKIKEVLVKSGVSDEVIKKAFRNEEKLLSKFRWGVLLAIVFFVVVIVLTLFILLSSQNCSESSDCPDGYLCSGNVCVKSEGMMNCEVVGCEQGYDCYKCLRETMM
jgi:preprotein translocase subunit SecG